MQLRLSKTIGKWTIHASIDDVFDQKTVDSSTHINELEQNMNSTHHQQEITERTYDLYKRLFMLGVVYGF